MRAIRVLAIVAVLVGVAPQSAHAAPSAGVVDIPIAFSVVNKNDSPLPCPSDGRRYTVRGHLVGPAAEVARPKDSVVSLLLYGWDAGEWNWRFADVGGYDYAVEMAKLGHVSASIDWPGYDSSDRPSGSQICWGSAADITHQVIQALRTGRYRAGSRAAPAFRTVLVSAHDVGPVAAVMEAYTWHDIDGITTQVLAHQGFEPYILDLYAQRVAECAQGGDDEYVYFGPPDGQFRSDLFLERRTDPAVIDAVIARRNRNPCGLVNSNGAAITMNRIRMSEVEVPALLVVPGPDDPVVSRDGEEGEAARYGGDDVTTAWLDSGHFMMLEQCAPAFRQLTAYWIHQRWGSGADVPMPAVGTDACVTEVRNKSAAPPVTSCTWGGTPDQPTGVVRWEAPGIHTLPAPGPIPFTATGVLAGDGCADASGQPFTMTFTGHYHAQSSCTLAFDDGVVTGVPGIVREETVGVTGLVIGPLYGSDGQPAGTWYAQVFTDPGASAATCGSPEGIRELRFSGGIQWVR